MILTNTTVVVLLIVVLSCTAVGAVCLLYLSAVLPEYTQPYQPPALPKLYLFRQHQKITTRTFRAHPSPHRQPRHRGRGVPPNYDGSRALIMACEPSFTSPSWRSCCIWSDSGITVIPTRYYLKNVFFVAGFQQKMYCENNQLRVRRGPRGSPFESRLSFPSSMPVIELRL